MQPRHRSPRLIAAAILLASGLLAPSSAQATHPTTALLPDLVMLQPGDFRLERKPGGVRWLRFSTVIANVGDGPFDVYGYDRAGGPVVQGRTLHVRQRIVTSVDSSGARTWVEHDAIGDDGRPSTMFYSGDNHAHWHVDQLQLFELAFAATPGQTIKSGEKTGFCFYDNVDLPEWHTPMEYSGSWACHATADQTRVPMGQAVGWGDEYPATIAGQYIDVTSRPYGDYCLTLTADPRGEFLEQTTANNKVRTLISIQSNGVTVLATECGDPDMTAPSTPSGLTATPGAGSVALDWDNNSEEDLSHYHIYRDGDPNRLASSTTSSYSDVGLEQVEYCYAVSAVDNAGNESAPSQPRCATPTEGTSTQSVHVADLDGRADVKGKSGRWEAFVTITVHDGSHTPVAGATVSGDWSGDFVASATGTTGSDGTVTLTTGTLSSGDAITFTLAGLTHSSLVYAAGDNHDPDGGTGTTVVVTRN